MLTVRVASFSQNFLGSRPWWYQLVSSDRGVLPKANQADHLFPIIDQASLRGYSRGQEQIQRTAAQV
jgi:hypothetical protein